MKLWYKDISTLGKVANTEVQKGDRVTFSALPGEYTVFDWVPPTTGFPYGQVIVKAPANVVDIFDFQPEALNMEWRV